MYIFILLNVQNATLNNELTGNLTKRPFHTFLVRNPGC